MPCTAREMSHWHGTARGKGGLLSRERRPPLNPPRERKGRCPLTPPLRDLCLKSCAACGIGCLLFFVSKRLDYLLSSLSLCLRFVTLTQSLPTLDFGRLVGACQGGIAALAASLIEKNDRVSGRFYMNKSSYGFPRAWCRAFISSG